MTICLGCRFKESHPGPPLVALGAHDLYQGRAEHAACLEADYCWLDCGDLWLITKNTLLLTICRAKAYLDDSNLSLRDLYLKLS